MPGDDGLGFPITSPHGEGGPRLSPARSSAVRRGIPLKRARARGGGIRVSAVRYVSSRGAVCQAQRAGVQRDVNSLPHWGGSHGECMQCQLRLNSGTSSPSFFIVMLSGPIFVIGLCVVRAGERWRGLRFGVHVPVLVVEGCRPSRAGWTDAWTSGQGPQMCVAWSGHSGSPEAM